MIRRGKSGFYWDCHEVRSYANINLLSFRTNGGKCSLSRILSGISYQMKLFFRKYSFLCSVFCFFFFSFSIFLSPLVIPLSMLSIFFKNRTSPPLIFPAEYFDHFTLLIQFCSGPLKNDWHFEIVQLLWTSNKEVRILLGMIYFKFPFTQFRMEHVYFLQKEFVLSPILFKIYNKTK